MGRYYIVMGMLLVSALVSWSLARMQSEGYEVRLKEFPMTMGLYRGRDVELKREDIVYAVLETTSVLSRVYENSNAKGEVVDLLLTYFERGHRGFHPPEVSFVASGNTIIRAGIVRIPLGNGESAPQLEANMFLGKTPTGEVLFLYWFGIGEQLMASYYKGSAYLLWSNLLQRPRAASMVRLALPVVNGDLERTMATAKEFIRQVVPVLPEYLTERPRTGAPRG
ncbi:MAG: exosortase C-terminal domain/associated protein EpsI [Nitrospiraceae bacterium]